MKNYNLDQLEFVNNINESHPSYFMSNLHIEVTCRIMFLKAKKWLLKKRK